MKVWAFVKNGPEEKPEKKLDVWGTEVGVVVGAAGVGLKHSLTASFQNSYSA